MTGDTTDLLSIRAGVAAGHALPSARHLPVPLQARLALAEQLGAPLLPELDLALDDAAADAELGAELRVATAQARAVTVGLVVAPLLVVPALGGLLGVDLVGFYLAPTGRVVLAVAGLLHAAGTAWIVAAVSRVRRRALASAPGSLEDVEVVRLLGVSLRSGLGVVGALRATADARPDVAAPLRQLALALDLGAVLPPAAATSSVARTLAAAVAVGSPVTDALVRLAADLLRERRTVVREAAARLPALLTVPTALLVLPATLLLIGAPVLTEAIATLGR